MKRCRDTEILNLGYGWGLRGSGEAEYQAYELCRMYLLVWVKILRMENGELHIPHLWYLSCRVFSSLSIHIFLYLDLIVTERKVLLFFCADSACRISHFHRNYEVFGISGWTFFSTRYLGFCSSWRGIWRSGVIS